MTKNQFFYTVQVGEDKTIIASFSLDRVIRTMEWEPGKYMILLDDFHEDFKDIPSVNQKTGKTTIQRMKKDVSSEIWLSEEDSIRFRELTSISEPILDNSTIV